jgi:hypothetical protein
MYFVVYKLYYVGQNNDLGIRVRLRNGVIFFYKKLRWLSFYALHAEDS